MSEFKGGESVATKKRKEKQGEIERLHEKTFKAWLNSQLRVRGIRLERDLLTELADGLVLINAVEILSGEKCPEKYNAKPTLEIHKIENITIAINFIQKFVKVSMSANDVVQGNMRLILGMIWRLILTFKVEGKDDENEKLTAAQRNRAAKKKLLDWCIEKTKGHAGVNIEDFGASWYDGLGFCALIHAFDPTLIDFDSLNASNAAHNLDLAFDLAEKHLDIPRLLDPADICAADPGSRPDEQCFMTYLSEFPIAFLANKEQADSRRGLEDAKRREEEARRKAEEEERRRREAEEEARRKAELEAQAEAMRKREADAKRKAEEDERERKAKEEKLKRKAEEALRAAEEKAKLDADEAARRAREEAERKAAKKAAKAKKKADEEERKRQAESEAREGEHEAERLRLEEECRRLRAELDATKGRLIGKLKVNVVEARGLKKADAFSKSDPYCVLFLERQKEKTRTIKKTLEPKWEADFEFYHSDPDASLEISVFDWNRIFSDDFLGKVTIPIADLRDGQETTTWYKLEGKKAKDKVSGEVHLKLLYRKEK